MNSFEIEIVLKIFLIIFCSLIIGFNRGKQNQFAGLKTHLLVGLGAGLSFLIPYVFYINHQIYTMDLYRLSAQVISGIGFLGAGTIIKSGRSIKGLTTAASLWTTAIIAMAIASGLYFISIFATMIVFLFLVYSDKLDITRKYSTKNFIIEIKNIENNLAVLDDFMKKNVVLKGDFIILKHINKSDETVTVLKYEILYRKTNMSTNDIIRNLSKNNFIKKMDLMTEMERV